jgi:hypothetical protein
VSSPDDVSKERWIDSIEISAGGADTPEAVLLLKVEAVTGSS